MQFKTELREALARLFDMDPEDATEVSSAVLDAFGASEELRDDTIDQDLRSLFYTLEAKKLLAFRREEYDAETGDRRRAFYWRLRMDEIQRAVAPRAPEAERDVYATLPASAWKRSSAS